MYDDCKSCPKEVCEDVWSKYKEEDTEFNPDYLVCDTNNFVVTPKCVTAIGYFKIGDPEKDCVIHRCDTFLEVCAYILNSEKSTLEDTLKYMKFKK
mgnify:CR=1 FL=1